HKWLFGGEDPPGVFVVSERLQRLRDLRSQRGILKTASIDARLLTYWNEHPHLKAGLEDMRLSVRSPRASIQPGGPAWQAKHSKVTSATLTRMKRLAEAETLKKQCEGAGF